MPRARALTDDVVLIRPLLRLRKRDCEDFCRTAGIAPRIDPSNADPSSRRGRLRRDVIPVLESMWPDAAVRAAGTAESVRAAAVAHEAHLAEVFGDAAATTWSRSALADLSVDDRAAGLRRALLALAPEHADAVGRRQLIETARAITAPGPRSFTWAGGLVIEIARDGVDLRKAEGGRRKAKGEEQVLARNSTFDDGS